MIYIAALRDREITAEPLSTIGLLRLLPVFIGDMHGSYKVTNYTAW